MSHRPRSVIVLAVILLIAAVIEIIVGTIFGIMTALPTNQVLLMIFLTSFFTVMFSGNSVPMGTALLYANALSYYYFQYTVFLNEIIDSGIDIFAIICVIIGISLVSMKKWARYLSLALGVVMIIGGILSLASIIGVIPLIVGIVIVAYLMTDVKYEFE